MLEGGVYARCVDLNKILNRDGSTKITKSITGLHVTRLHPHYSKELLNLDKNILVKYIWSNKFFGILIALLVIFGSAINIILKIAIKRNKNKKFHKEIDYLIISHLISVKQHQKKDDFYFGNTENELDLKNKKVIKVLINHTLINENHVNLGKEGVEKIIAPNYLSLKLEIIILIKITLELISFIKFIREEQAVNKLVFGYVIKSIISRSTQKNLRLYYFLTTAFENTEIKNILFTYEGFAWERLVSKFASNKKAVSIGYMHSAVFKETIAIKNALGGGYDPNYLVVAGCGIKQALLREKKFEPSRVGILGTGRKSSIDKPRVREKICLVIPEGIATECEILFEYSQKCALAFPDIRFIWRLHPVIKVQMLKKYMKVVKKTKNIIISDQEIEEDIKISKWALYRGSTAIITAASTGVIPIYLRLKEDINIDPLYLINKCVVSRDNIDEFYACINKVQISDGVINYSENFYCNLDVSIFNNMKYDEQNIYC